MYTLWRGSTELGRFSEWSPVTHHGNKTGASGMLELLVPEGELSGVWQTRIEHTVDELVIQKPTAMLERLYRSAPESGQGPTTAPIPLRSTEGPSSVPAEDQLRICTSDGVEIATQMITLDRFRVAPDMLEKLEFLRDAPSHWMVSFSMRDPPDA